MIRLTHMVIQSAPEHATITLVCCVHGNEIFGVRVFDTFKAMHDRYANVSIILANTEALQRRVRYTETDLNRCFPGAINGTHEERLAYTMMPHIANGSIVLDVHTTTSTMTMVPIITKTDAETMRIVQYTQANNVVYVPEQMSMGSMIYHAKIGVSLEFGEQYAKTDEALSDIIRIVDDVLNKKEPAYTPSIYQVTGTIPLTADIPRQTPNFSVMPNLPYTPFLLDEESYKHIHRGFMVTPYSIDKNDRNH